MTTDLRKVKSAGMTQQTTKTPINISKDIILILENNKIALSLDIKPKLQLKK